MFFMCYPYALFSLLLNAFATEAWTLGLLHATVLHIDLPQLGTFG